MTENHAIDLLMEHKGEVVAATGWEGYIAAGRGLVMTDGTTAHYIPLSMLRRLPPDLRRRVLPLVQSYRPTTQVVAVLVVELDRTIALAVGTRTPPLPPEAAFLKHAGTPGCPPMQVIGIPVSEVEREAQAGSESQ